MDPVLKKLSGELGRRVRDAGLEMLGYAGNVQIPGPHRAWSIVSRGDVIPAATLAPTSTTNERHAQWLRGAQAEDIISGNGEFLLSVGGLAALPWAHVRLSQPACLGDFPEPGEPSFIAADLTGRRLCAVTTEEHAFWIILAHVGGPFSGP